MSNETFNFSLSSLFQISSCKTLNACIYLDKIHKKHNVHRWKHIGFIQIAVFCLNFIMNFIIMSDILIMLFGQFEGMKLNLEQNWFQYRQLLLKSGSTSCWSLKKTRLDGSFNRVWGYGRELYLVNLGDVWTTDDS